MGPKKGEKKSRVQLSVKQKLKLMEKLDSCVSVAAIYIYIYIYILYVRKSKRCVILENPREILRNII